MRSLQAPLTHKADVGRMDSFVQGALLLRQVHAHALRSVFRELLAYKCFKALCVDNRPDQLIESPARAYLFMLLWIGRRQSKPVGSRGHQGSLAPGFCRQVVNLIADK